MDGVEYYQSEASAVSFCLRSAGDGNSPFRSHVAMLSSTIKMLSSTIKMSTSCAEVYLEGNSGGQNSKEGDLRISPQKLVIVVSSSVIYFTYRIVPGKMQDGVFVPS